MLNLFKAENKIALPIKMVRAFLLLSVFSGNAFSQKDYALSKAEQHANLYSKINILAQPLPKIDSSQVIKSRLIATIIIGGVAYAGGMTGLYNTWYSQYGHEGFHFFNDNGEWLKMDKLGHTGTAYQVGLWATNALDWTGLERNKSIWYGAGYAYLFLTTIEVFDGFSTGWGFSKGDMIANTIGSGLLVSQELLWNEPRFAIKFSVHASPYANVRPNLLGLTPAERVLKDYNGQTYWLSGNIACWLNSESKFPKWINVDFGYGAEGMTGGSSNPDFINGIPAPYFKRYPQFYLSPGIDLTRIPVKSKVLKSIFNVAGFLKIPMPALEYNSQKKFVFHGLYF